mgnify:CR=1 FL=1
MSSGARANDNNKGRWWLEKDEDLFCSAMIAAAEQTDEITRERQDMILDSYTLYGGDTTGVFGSRTSLTEKLPDIRWLGHNAISTVIDTLVGELMQTPAAPMASTTGGDFLDHHRAECLTEWWKFEIDHARVHRLLPQVVRDACVAGLGCYRPYSKADDIFVERIHPLMILMDDVSSLDTTPPQMFIRRFVDRRQLIDRYPKHEEAILKATRPSHVYAMVDEQGTTDEVTVYEGWRIGKKGVYAVVVDGAVLERHTYDRPSFPLVFLHAILPLSGFWGLNMVQRMAPAQAELNKLLRRVQQAMHIMAVPRIYVQDGSINTSKFDNGIGDIVTYTGSPPQVHTPPSMGGDVYGQIERLVKFIYQVGMINAMNAGGDVPQNLRSGRAVRLVLDFTSRLFRDFQRRLEWGVCDLAWEMLRVKKQLGGNAVHKDRWGRYKTEEFSEIDIDEAEMTITVQPVNALADDPPSQLEDIAELVANGVLTQKDAIRASTIPDFAALRRRILAPEDLIDKRLSTIARTGKYLGPEPYMNLEYAVIRGAEVTQEAELAEAGRTTVKLLRKFTTDSFELLQRGQEAAARQQAEVQMMAGPPMGAPPPGQEQQGQPPAAQLPPGAPMAPPQA